MTSPREQAIEAAAKAAYAHGGSETSWDETGASFREHCIEYTGIAIDAYLAARARLDGAKMMPREATEEMLEAGIDAANSRRPVPDIYRAMHDATPKDGER
ncbi:MAG: hypothetical protein ACOZAM_14990 [Pseudomonadota bacterium]